MWRSFFCAIGVSALILGGEFLVIDRATLKMPSDETGQPSSILGQVNETIRTKDFTPPEWAPWSLLSFGAVLVLYSNSTAKP